MGIPLQLMITLWLPFVTPTVTPPPPPPMLAVDPGTSAMDWLVAFGANYGNEAADMLHGGEGATGSVSNHARFNLRLVWCESVNGAMTQHFPLIISPDTHNADISGYVKKDGKRDKKLEQVCFYEIYKAKNEEDEKYDAWFKGSKAVATGFVELGFSVKIHIDEINWDNSVSVRFVSHENKWDPLKGPHTAQAGRVNDESRKKTATLRECSENSDICVQASIGTGPNPRFRFEITPLKNDHLTTKACKGYGGKSGTRDGTTTGEDGTKDKVRTCAGGSYCKLLGHYFSKTSKVTKKEWVKKCTDPVKN